MVSLLETCLLFFRTKFALWTALSSKATVPTPCPLFIAIPVVMIEEGIIVPSGLASCARHFKLQKSGGEAQKL